jgi:hypothetical protein
VQLLAVVLDEAQEAKSGAIVGVGEHVLVSQDGTQNLEADVEGLLLLSPASPALQPLLQDVQEAGKEPHAKALLDSTYTWTSLSEEAFVKDLDERFLLLVDVL